MPFAARSRRFVLNLSEAASAQAIRIQADYSFAYPFNIDNNTFVGSESNTIRSDDLMKSEERHQLQQNELAEVLGSGINSLAPYGRAIGLAVVGIIAIVFVYNFLAMQNKAHDSTASLDFLLATANEDPESFKRVSQDFGDTTAGAWAQQAQADHNLAAGIDSLFIDRDEANAFLEAATENYKSILANATDPLLKTRANFGLAKAYEAQGELDKAMQAFQVVADSTNSDAMAKQAKDRIEQLSSSDMQDFYAWFAENQPVAPATESPTLPKLEDLPDSPLQGLPPVQAPDVETDEGPTDSETSNAPVEAPANPLSDSGVEKPK